MKNEQAGQPSSTESLALDSAAGAQTQTWREREGETRTAFRIPPFRKHVMSHVAFACPGAQVDMDWRTVGELLNYRAVDMEHKLVQDGVRHDAIFLKIMKETFQVHLFRLLQKELLSQAKDSDLVVNVFSKNPQVKVGKAAPYIHPYITSGQAAYVQQLTCTRQFHDEAGMLLMLFSACFIPKSRV